jgi:uncharacterized OB-fold protein
MPNFCPNCATALSPDSRICPSCRTPVGGVARALASEISGSVRAGVMGVVTDAGHSVPPPVWAASLQIYWLLTGLLLTMIGASMVSLGTGLLDAASSLTSGLISGGAQIERVLLLGFLAFLTGIWDTCLSVALVYGFLTLKSWTRGVFMVWLPVKAGLLLLMVLAKPSSAHDQQSGPTPFVVVFVLFILVALHVGALVLEFVLVRRTQAAEYAGAALPTSVLGQCPHCASINPPDLRFCESCGTSLG